MTINAIDLIKENKVEVDKVLEKWFEEEMKEVPENIESGKKLLEISRDFCLNGGKRVRPLLTLIGYELFGGKEVEKARKVAAALELVHAYLLIHDDVIDEASIRRGKPTVHETYKSENGDLHFGNSMAILSGDLLVASAHKLILTSGFDPEILSQIITKINKTISDTVYGQELDVRMAMVGGFTSEDVLKMMKLKTAKYTFENPLLAGAILGGATEGQMELLSRLLIPSGISFQLRDDLLDIYGKSEEGRPVGGDLKQGKFTLSVAKALEQADDGQKKELERVLGNKDITEGDIESVKSILEESGTLKFCDDLLEEYSKEIEEVLEELRRGDLDPQAIEKLETIADFATTRKY